MKVDFHIPIIMIMKNSKYNLKNIEIKSSLDIHMLLYTYKIIIYFSEIYIYFSL